MITTLRIEDDLKRECDSVLDDIGLNFSSAINVFLKELARRRAVPFELRASEQTAKGGVQSPAVVTMPGRTDCQYGYFVPIANTDVGGKAGGK